MSETPASPRFFQRVYLVTGANGGVGRAVATALATEGATVILLGRTLPGLERVYDQIVAAGHSTPILFPMDLAATVDADFESLAAAIRFQLGRLDGIVHAASAFESLAPLHQQTSAEWLALYKTNVIAPFLLNQACHALLKAAPQASVILIGEQHGRQPKGYWGGFAVAGGALENYFTIQAEEWKSEPQLNLQLLIPGPIRSPQRAKTHPGEDKTALPETEAVARFILDSLAHPRHGERLEWSKP